MFSRSEKLSFIGRGRTLAEAEGSLSSKLEAVAGTK